MGEEDLKFIMGIDGENTHGEKGLISMGYDYTSHPDTIFWGGTKTKFINTILELESNVKNVELCSDGMTKIQVKKVVNALKSIGVKEKNIEIY